MKLQIRYFDHEEFELKIIVLLSHGQNTEFL